MEWSNPRKDQIKELVVRSRLAGWSPYIIANYVAYVVGNVPINQKAGHFNNRLGYWTRMISEIPGNPVLYRHRPVEHNIKEMLDGPIAE